MLDEHGNRSSLPCTGSQVQQAPPLGPVPQPLGVLYASQTQHRLSRHKRVDRQAGRQAGGANSDSKHENLCSRVMQPAHHHQHLLGIAEVSLTTEHKDVYTNQQACAANMVPCAPLLTNT